MPIPYQLEPREITKKADPKRVAIASSFLTFLGVTGLVVPLLITIRPAGKMPKKSMTAIGNPRIGAKEQLHTNKGEHLQFLNYKNQITFTDFGLLQSTKNR